MKIGTAFVEVRPDTKQFATELDRNVTDAAKKTSLRLSDALAGGLFLAGANKAQQAASQLQQAVGGTTAVFAESADTIEEFASRSDEAAGLSARAARELTSQIGGLLKGFGFTQDEAAKTSVELAQLGADLSATFGGNPEDAVIALGAALRGEFNPLERYGVSLNQTQVNLRAVEMGLATSTSKVDLSAKANAALAIIMERSADAQGQFGREAETAAGQAAIAAAKQENAAADLGESLLPIYTKISEVTGTVADGFADLPDAVQTGVIALAGIAVAIRPARAGVEALRDGMAVLRGAFVRGADGTSTFTRGVGKLGTAAKVAGGVAGVGALTVALIELGGGIDQVNIDVDDLAAGLANLTDEQAEGVQAILRQAQAWGDLESVFRTVADSDVIAAEQLLKQAQAAGIAGEELEALRDIVESKREADVQGAANQAEYTEQVDAAVGPTQDLGAAQEDTTDKAADLREEIDELTEAFERQFEAISSSLDAERGYEDALIAVWQAQQDLNAAQAEGDPAEIAAATRDLEDAQIAAAEAAVQLRIQQEEATGKQVDAQDEARILKEEYEKLALGLAPDSPLRARLLGLAGQLDKVSDKHTVQVDTVEAQGAVAALISIIALYVAAAREANRVFRPLSTGTRSGGGVPIFHGGIERVPGLPGQEVPAILEAGERVISAEDNRRGTFGGSTFNVTLNNPDRAAVESLPRTLRRVAVEAGG